MFQNRVVESYDHCRVEERDQKPSQTQNQCTDCCRVYGRLKQIGQGRVYLRQIYKTIYQTYGILHLNNINSADDYTRQTFNYVLMHPDFDIAIA